MQGGEVVGCGAEVGVDEEEREHVVGVGAQPGDDRAEVRGEVAGVEDVAGGVAGVERGVEVVRF